MQIATYFQPYQLQTGARQRGCFTCENFHGQFFSAHVVFEHRGATWVIGQPQNGCAYWQREPGSDDQ